MHACAHHIWGITLTSGTFHARCHFSSYGRESAIYITHKLLPDPYIVTRIENINMETRNNGELN